MPSKTDYARKTKWKKGPYRGERGVGGNVVYADTSLLDKHLFVHNVSPGGFDWGQEASDDKAGQLAIALLAPWKGVDFAVENYHLFAENYIRRELTEDTWEVRTRDFRNKDHFTAYAGRDYPPNTAPTPRDVPELKDTDLDSITYAEEIALAEKYKEVLWTHGNRRDNLRRLLRIWDGTETPRDDSISSGTLYRVKGLNIPSNARSTLAREFGLMGDLAAWVLYCPNHSRMKGISSTSAEGIKKSRQGFIQYFGGEEFIPEYDHSEVPLTESPTRDESQQTLNTLSDS